MSGNDYTVPIASSPVAKETQVEGHPEMTLSPSEPLRCSTRIQKPVVRLNLQETVWEELWTCAVDINILFVLFFLFG